MSQKITDPNPGLIGNLIRFSLEKKLIVFIVLLGVLFAGFSTAPFDWNLAGLPRSPIPVDAIPDIGENQQIVFTNWNGRSPQDVEDQITYPLTVQLMGVPGVKTIRSYSYFGFSSIYVIFKEDVEFYWSRSRILEKLSSLPAGVLPSGVQPALGPDATALGQVYWYTLEGLDSEGKPTGGWDLDELRSINDFYVRYALQSVEGVAEVAAAGGMVREYQIDIDPDKLRHYDISIEQVYKAVSESNQDVGARTVEINRMEYVIRGKGNVRNIDDLKATVIKDHDNHPVYLEQVAHVYLGPAPRRGALDKGGADVTGGVVVVRYGDNPLEAIKGIEAKIAEIAAGLPQRVLDDGTISKVSVVPFYNRAGLIYETLDTLSSALSEEILITVIVILFMLGHLRSSIVISLLLPAAVLACFVAMKLFGVDANVVALSGIAIAIGTMVDMGIIISENIVIHLQQASEKDSKVMVVYRATKEVAGAVVTAVATTIISFIPVFTMTAAEGKLFKPLAFTKTFALGGALALSLFVIPPLAVLLFKKGKEFSTKRQERNNKWFLRGLLVLATVVLSHHWLPLGPEFGEFLNLLFVSLLLFGVLWLIQLFIKYYPHMLGWCLEHKVLFLSAPILILIMAGNIWRTTGNEFMPALDEGSYLLMPTTMPHAGFEEAQEQLALLDQMIETVPEVEMAVGKLGRAETSLDPAPTSMYEIVINYKNEYGVDSTGGRVRQWRDHIKSPDDIWNEIVKVTKIPGVTSAPKLMPIAARIVMLQSGMRAPMGLKVKGPNLQSIEAFGMKVEKYLKDVEGVEPATVIADRIVGKPYLEFDIDRRKAARFGLSIKQIQMTLMTALGGRTASYTVEGRERYPIRIRYMREKRDDLDAMRGLLIRTSRGVQVPISQVATINFSRGPMVIKSEDGFLVGYVVFDKESGLAETEVVESAQSHLQHLIDNGTLSVPDGVSYVFTGNYENQLRAKKTLSVVLPIALLVILLILYLQFGSFSTTLMIFSGILVAWAGGFLLIGLYNTEWFLNFSLFGVDFRELFQIRTVNLSVAVWVGFIALFGVASDNGVVISEYLKQKFSKQKANNKQEVRKLVIEAATRRIRPCLMTTATTLLALIPVLTSTGRGSDIMLPMSIPSFGGMLVVIISVFVVPVLYSIKEERKV
ncbi:MAG: efflux RND transporter permease subunit [Fibrobacterales bacterium]